MNYLTFTTINQPTQNRSALFLTNVFILTLSLIFIKIAPASIEVLSSDQTGITLRLTVEDLSISEQKIDDELYHVISYKDCQNTREPSNPKIPLSRVMLGVPVSAVCEIRVIDSSPAIEKYGYRVLPVPEIDYHQPIDLGAPPVTKFVYKEDGSAYQSNGFYPSNAMTESLHSRIVRIVNDGFIRNQRVITVEFCPIQYSPRRRLIKVYSILTVRVDFNISHSAPTMSPIMGDATTMESPQFEKLYQANLINYADAKNWRSIPPQPQAAPKLSTAISANSEPAARSTFSEPAARSTYKIFVEDTGIYRLTYEELRAQWNIDLSKYDPRYFKMLNRGKEIRIYIKGESDGSFGQGDYIEFLGIKADSGYTRWNVYWLVCGAQNRGMRVAEMEGQPSDPIAKIVPSFLSKLYFEKDLLHNVLPEVHPDQVSGGDPGAWFEALDLWYWTGVKNASEETEVAINFKLYDVAQSFKHPEINVLLRGGTPAEHEAVISVNDIKIAAAKWFSQDEFLASKSLHSSYSIVDATLGDNIIRLSKVDSDVNKNAMKYPYHLYINRFDIEYTRLLYAVNDQLKFKTPKPKSNEDYSVRKKRKLEYTINHFLDPEIEVFEVGQPVEAANNMLVARIRNVEINQVDLTPEDRKRLTEMFRSNQKAFLEDNFAQETVNPKFVDIVDIPDVAYNATFQYPDSHDAHFIALSKKATLRPARIEIDKPNDLLDRTNQADYIIITHPNFLDAAKRLADWRETQKGGGHRAKVVDVTDIYDEFNYGMVSPQAIKDFLTYAFFNWTPPKVTNVVILADGTYDLLGVDKEIYEAPPELTGFIPPHYMWSNSYGQTATDHWYATISGIDALPDLFVGRIPVEEPEQAHAVVDKLISYEKNPVNGPWRRRIISVADDEATNSGDKIFRDSLEEIAQNHTLLGYSTTKIYLEDIIKKLKEDPDAFEEHLKGLVAKRMISEELSKGAVLIQYSGHGSPVVWAHEIILDNYAVEKLDNTDKLPFVIVLSCYNGYFDRPGEPCLAETFLRLPKAGSIGMFSATRLTYGLGNESLNKIIFDEIFRRNMRTLGEICFSAKVETMVKEGISQLAMMEDYTLFGDPAMKLLLADYEVKPELENYTVGPSQKLQLKEGQLYKTVYNKAQQIKEYIPISNFSGKMTVTAKFPGYIEVMDEGLQIEKSVNVVNGKYPAVTISVPSSVESGSGIIEYYAESASEIAVGGVSFNVEIPKILDIKTELISENSFVVSVLIADEFGKAGIEQIKLYLNNPIDEMIKMEPTDNLNQQSGIWYSHSTPIKLPESGRAVKYTIYITDRDGNTISSNMEFQPMEVPDFHIVSETESFKSLIYYKIDYENKKYFLKAEIENLEDNKVREPVEVYFYKGNPDLDEDYLIDEDAHLIGKTTVSPESWQRRNPIDKYRTSITGEPPRAFELAPLNINWISVASIEVGRAAGSSSIEVGRAAGSSSIEVERAAGSSEANLENGTHRIFVYVDGSRSISETYEKNNISDRTIELNSQFVGDKDLRVFSNDRVFDVRIPADVLDLAIQNERTVGNLSVVPSEFPKPVNQPDIEMIDLPFDEEQPISAYSMKLYSSLDTPTPSLITRHSSPVTIELRFDLLKFRELIKDKIGLGGILDYELTGEQKEQVKQAMNDEAKNISIFLWGEEARKWFKVDSEVLFDEKGNILEQLCPVIDHSSLATRSLPLEVVFENNAVPDGKWVANFTSSTQYDLYFAKEDERLEKIESDIELSSAWDLATTSPSGLKLISRSGIRKFGDTVKFETRVSSNSIEAQSSRLVNFTSSNYGNGGFRYLKIENEARSVEAQSSAIADRWLILFIDRSHFWLKGEKSGIVEQNGKTQIGKIGEEFVASPFGISFIIDAGNDPFVAGDSFLFEARPVGRVHSKTDLIGKFTLMITHDIIPPDVQFTVSGQNFVDGDAVSSNPQIQAIISDDNGVDLFTRKMEFLINEDNISQDEYLISTNPGANQVVLNYNPDLSSGKYELALKVYDLSGNESEKSMEFHINTTTQLLNPMNYPNPFRTRKGTTITCEVTSEIADALVKIYTLSGRLIRELEEEEGRTMGFLEFHWDGRDYDGRGVANGVYYAKIILKREDDKDLIDYVKIMKLR